MSHLLKRLARNTQGRDWIVGDVHGHFTRLQQALHEVQFDESRDRLISVGDLVDRGPESMQVLDWLKKPWLHAVRGNHESMAIDYAAYAAGTAPRDWRDWYAENGGTWNIANLRDVQQEVAASLAALPVAIELETTHGLVGVVHADCPMASWSDFTQALADPHIHALDLKQLVHVAQWNRQRIDMGDHVGVQGVYLVVVGHAQLRVPELLGNVMHIDTGGWNGRGFTLLDPQGMAIHTSHAVAAQ